MLSQARLISDVAGSGRIDNPRLRCADISQDDRGHLSEDAQPSAGRGVSLESFGTSACATSPGEPIHSRGNRLP